ncbi:serine hydrolase [Jeotgalibacillus salarius]|uniref:D-alanyl-D-alanine carboxypeptidase n=1 Tax=Jeotgalibacillus salarius TaxID=546023 RepID=A0A4Y8LHR9_9BACL|nr:serine hydrolase [Jeotgalibacillus salarius]TFE02370.1 D-alanyl-D-alanine carboxypeptidase [Jeotgalibacillus salarius]
MNWIFIGSMIVALLIGGGSAFFAYHTRKIKPRAFTQFIKERPDTISLKVQRNDEVLVAQQENLMLPLASTAKMVIAVEYAKQAASGNINPDEVISLSTLEPFYFKRTDGGAHEAWLKEINRQDPVTLSQVAEGMMHYSSNANSDYLMHKLGLDRINAGLEETGLTDHEPIFPFVAALAVPYILTTEQNLTLEGANAEIRDMSKEEYRNMTIMIMERWLDQPCTDQEKQQILKCLTAPAQKNWSDHLTRSNAKTYTDFMEKLNSKTFFSKKVHSHLDPLLEPLMESPKNREWLRHTGQKGGSTPHVLTFSLYATDLKDNRTEISFFADGLELLEQIRLSKSMNDFQKAILRDEDFRTHITEKLSQKH